MSCEFKKETLEAYAAGILDGKDQTDVENHIRSCDGCRSELAHLKCAALMLKCAFDEEAPSWLAQKTLAHLKLKPKHPFSWFAWGLPALAGGIAVVLLLVAGPEIKTRFGGAPEKMSVSVNEKPAMEEIVAPAPEDRVCVLPGGIADEFAINLENPINDRSIYVDLGVVPKVAKLLL